MSVRPEEDPIRRLLEEQSTLRQESTELEGHSARRQRFFPGDLTSAALAQAEGQRVAPVRRPQSAQ